MKHPDPEVWMDYLYGEKLPQPERDRLRVHLETCDACRRQYGGWQETQAQLNRWSLTPRRSRPPGWQRWLPRAAVAAVLLATGLVTGRHLGAPNPDLATLRAEVRQELQQDLSAALAQSQATLRQTYLDDLQTILAEFSHLQEQRREKDLTTVAAAIARLEDRHQRDSTAMRRDLETVAILTDASLRQTQDQVVQLASLPLGSSRPNPDQP